jgi:hypothetical protein
VLHPDTCQQALAVDKKITEDTCFVSPWAPRCSDKLYEGGLEMPPPAGGYNRNPHLKQFKTRKEYLDWNESTQVKIPTRYEGERTEKIQFEIPYCD